ncbi:unnamed protein product [Leptosia nina]|uniref:Uncharacterized protein n=1 Tax=Leptosia nina TaxID=320188 RepID=A0AAV1J340_9NEOP
MNVKECLFVSLFFFHLIYFTKAMTRQQLKNSGKLMKKSCMPKNDVTEDQVGQIEQGKFIEERNVMCYIACVYTMTQVIKNNKISYDAVIKQVDTMFPPEMRDAVKAAAANCKDISKKYKDICEASYWTAKYDETAIKKTMTVMKNQCMPKNGVNNDKVGKIEQGVFLEDHNVMCYIACVYKAAMVVKNNRLDKDLIIKQIDVLYPTDLRVPAKKGVEKCFDLQYKYDDGCEGIFYSTKCLYESYPASFVFPPLAAHEILDALENVSDKRRLEND